jgi:ABC-type transporter Mla maintaining outer membrane lipid asymmetry permease subunit MlaE
MALSPVRYVVVPKFHAITVVMPILVMFSILVSEMEAV